MTDTIKIHAKNVIPGSFFMAYLLSKYKKASVHIEMIGGLKFRKAGSPGLILLPPLIHDQLYIEGENIINGVVAQIVKEGIRTISDVKL